MFLLLFATKTKTKFLVKYYDQKKQEAQVSFLVDDGILLCDSIENNPFKFTECSAKLRPGIHTLIMKQGDSVIIQQSIFLIRGSYVIEYMSHDSDSAYTRVIQSHFGKLLPD
jgi:hypothetical protein